MEVVTTVKADPKGVCLSSINKTGYYQVVSSESTWVKIGDIVLVFYINASYVAYNITRGMAVIESKSITQVKMLNVTAMILETK
jgi:hypothetical protein